MRETVALDARAAAATVDRAATIGIAVTLVLAAGLIVLDPIQHVDRRAAPAAPAVSAPAVSEVAPSALQSFSLPDEPPAMATNGSIAAYPRVGTAGAMEIVIRDLGGPGWRVGYRTAANVAIGPLAMSSDRVIFEETLLRGGAPVEVRIGSLDVSSGEYEILDRFVPFVSSAAGFAGALPRSDGDRLAWVRRADAPSGARSEIRIFDEATGRARTVVVRSELVIGIALWRQALAFTVQPEAGPAASYRMDLSTGAISALGELYASYVQTVGPKGVFLLGATRADDAQIENWLIAADGSATRVGSGCTEVAHNERILALRCDTRLEVRDLQTGATLDRFAPGVGAIAIFDEGVAWTEGAELRLYPASPASIEDGSGS